MLQSNKFYINRIKSAILAGLLFATAHTATAQLEPDALERRFIDLDREKNDFSGLVHGSFNYQVNSNSVPNNFLSRLVDKGYINNSLKDDASARLKDKNRAGLDLYGGLTGKARLNTNLGFVAGVYYREHYDSKFTKDLFELVFRGNAPFAGKTLNIAPFKLTNFSYQSLYLGLEKSVNDKLYLGGGVNFIKGGIFRNIQLNHGTLYTEQFGTYVDINADPEVNFTDGKNRFASNGFGASLNLYGNYRTEKGIFAFEVRDLGFISWKKLNHYQGDSTYRYEGEEVADIFSINNSLFQDLNKDSITSDLGIKNNPKKMQYLIPATFHVNYTHFCSEKVNFVAGAKYMINANYIPRIYIRPEYMLAPDLVAAATFAYGGYGRGDFELGLAKNFKKSVIVSLNIFYFEKLVLPRKSSGQGININLAKTF